MNDVDRFWDPVPDHLGGFGPHQSCRHAAWVHGATPICDKKGLKFETSRSFIGERRRVRGGIQLASLRALRENDENV